MIRRDEVLGDPTGEKIRIISNVAYLEEYWS